MVSWISWHTIFLKLIVENWNSCSKINKWKWESFHERTIYMMILILSWYIVKIQGTNENILIFSSYLMLLTYQNSSNSHTKITHFCKFFLLFFFLLFFHFPSKNDKNLLEKKINKISMFGREGIGGSLNLPNMTK